MLKRSILAIALVSLLTASAAHAQQATLVFTAIPDEDETRLVDVGLGYVRLGQPARAH